MYYKVQLELHTFCNRSCPWCFVPYFKRNKLDNLRYMSDDVFFKTLSEIVHNQDLFHQPLEISLVRHQEPLYDSKYLQHRVKQLRKYFREHAPSFKYKLHMFTNGDYLNDDTVLDCIGVDGVYVNDYDNSGYDGVIEKIKSIKLFKNKKELDLYKLSKNNYDTDLNKEYIGFNQFGTYFKFYINSKNNFRLRSKGSFLQKDNPALKGFNWIEDCRKRDYECDILDNILNIEYNGIVMTCCDTIPDVSFHNELNLGNILNGISSFIDKYNDIDTLKCKACETCHMKWKNCLGEYEK